ncbi:MAG: hypothetical protein KGK34_02220 [Chloroflexota bacterium]|nr:hypothetical protein [Chloroflexota bacterium]
MAHKQPVPSIEQLRAEYADAVKRDPKKALINMKIRASQWRVRRGLPDEQNTALALIRELGVRDQQRDLYPTLSSYGYRDCVDWAKMPKNAQAVLERFVRFTKGTLPNKASIQELTAFLERPERPDYAKRQKDYEYHRLKQVAAELDRKHVHPFFAPKHVKWVRLPECAPKIRSEAAALSRFCVRSKYTRATEAGLVGRLIRSVRYLRARKSREARGLVAVIWPRGGIEALCRWWFEPDETGKLQSEYEPASFFFFVKVICESSGRSGREVDDRIREAKRHFRSSGRDHGKLNLIETRPAEPPPAPSDKQVAAGYASLEARIAELAAAGPDKQHSLADVLDDRNMTVLCHRLACRLSSLASLRYDELKIDPETGDLYFDNVVVKPNRNRSRNLVHEAVHNRRGYARWYIVDPAIVLLLHQAGLARGIDVLGWLRTGDRSCLRWVTVPRTPVKHGRWTLAPSDPFGEIAMGQEVAPVWFGPNDGYLRVGGVNVRVVATLRTHFKVKRGGAHVWRRRAVLETEEQALRHGQALERLHHMTPETRRRYRVGTDWGMKNLSPEGASLEEILSGIIPLPRVDAKAPVTGAAPTAARSTHSNVTVMRRRSRIRMLTAADILRRGA